MADKIKAKYGPDKLWPPVISKELHEGNFRLGTGLYGDRVMATAGREHGEGWERCMCKS